MEREMPTVGFDFSKIFYPIFLAVNAVRLRVPIFEKKECRTLLLRKEIGEIGVEVPFGENLVQGVPVKVFCFYFNIEGQEVPIEVNRDIFQRHPEGKKIPVEYLVGSDRIHARIKPRRNKKEA